MTETAPPIDDSPEPGLEDSWVAKVGLPTGTIRHGTPEANKLAAVSEILCLAQMCLETDAQVIAQGAVFKELTLQPLGCSHHIVLRRGDKDLVIAWEYRKAS